MPFKSYRKESRTDWGAETDQNISREQIELGALLRIADATELMCKDREKLERDYKYMRESRGAYRAALEVERRRSAALRGVITKMKKAQQPTRPEGE